MSVYVFPDGTSSMLANSTATFCTHRLRRFLARRIKPVIGILCAAIFSFGSAPATPCSAQPSRGPARVVTCNAVDALLAENQSFVGTLQATRRAEIGSAVEGRVAEVLFDAGDPVGSVHGPGSSAEFEGQPLIRLQTTTIDIEVTSAEIQAELAQQACDELELTLPQNLALAKANLAEAETQLENALTKYRRAKNLQVQSGAISQQEVDDARNEYESQRQLRLGFRAEVTRLITTSDLQMAQASTRARAAAQELLRLQDLRDKYTIAAPFEGVVTRKLSEVGAWVNRGAAIAEIVQLDPIEMIVNVPQEYSGQLQQSMLAAKENGNPLAASISINGLETPYPGEVVRIIPQADLRSRSFPVRIRISNPRSDAGFDLQSGMLGRASMPIGRRREMVMVKKDALVLGQQGTTVYKIGKDGDKSIAIPVPVTAGTEFRDWIQVTGAIAGEDRVIVLGNERLRPRSEVEITESRSEELNP